MAEKRKLLIEMEKCFKKIDEGIEIFDESMSKVNDSIAETQRDKLQDELKKEIKKLQRLREQVKVWQCSPEIKDKEKLNQYRRIIETRMETFKNVEREFKTKTHSNQGLAAEEKLDPKVKEKEETLDWLNTQIRRIQDEIDRTEAKIESLSTEAAGKKRGKNRDNRNVGNDIEELTQHLERVKFHWKSIEVCMRLITNEKLNIDDVNKKLKEPLIMYVDALDSDCDDDLENLEPDDVYADLGIDDYISQLDANQAPQIIEPDGESVAELDANQLPQIIESDGESVAQLDSVGQQIDLDDAISPIDFEEQEVDVDYSTLELDFAVQAAEEAEEDKVDYRKILKDYGDTYDPSVLPVVYTSDEIPDYCPAHVLFSADTVLFNKFQLETLFFSFYYMEGTIAHYLSAIRLKEVSWRFNTSDQMWYQRKDDPIEATDEFERGTYFYFNYSVWKILQVRDFTFRYEHLVR